MPLYIIELLCNKLISNKIHDRGSGKNLGSSDVVMMNNEELVYYSSVGMIFVSVVAFVAEVLGLSIPYGRYSQSSGSGWGFKLPARTAWVLMESPTLYTVAYMLLKGRNECITNPANKILIAMFVIHYVHRALIFPFRMGHGAPMPVTVMLLAFFYCFWNGCTQGLYLASVHSYE